MHLWCNNYATFTRSKAKIGILLNRWYLKNRNRWRLVFISNDRFRFDINTIEVVKIVENSENLGKSGNFEIEMEILTCFYNKSTRFCQVSG